MSLILCFVVPDLLMPGRPTSGLTLQDSTPNCCCKHTETTREWMLRRLRLLRKQHWWLDEQIILPTHIKKGAISSHSQLAFNNEEMFGLVHTNFM